MQFLAFHNNSYLLRSKLSKFEKKINQENIKKKKITLTKLKLSPSPKQIQKKFKKKIFLRGLTRTTLNIYLYIYPLDLFNSRA